MRNLELIVREFNIKHECLIALAKKLQNSGCTKAHISASRICCKLHGFVPQKYGSEL